MTDTPTPNPAQVARAATTLPANAAEVAAATRDAVDAALSDLDSLANRPLTDHHDILAQAHEKLHAIWEHRA